MCIKHKKKSIESKDNHKNSNSSYKHSIQMALYSVSTLSPMIALHIMLESVQELNDKFLFMSSLPYFLLSNHLHEIIFLSHVKNIILNLKRYSSASVVMFDICVYGISWYNKCCISFLDVLLDIGKSMIFVAFR